MSGVISVRARYPFIIFLFFIVFSGQVIFADIVHSFISTPILTTKKIKTQKNGNKPLEPHCGPTMVINQKRIVKPASDSRLSDTRKILCYQSFKDFLNNSTVNGLNLLLQVIIAVCALFVSYATLNHTAKPKIAVKMLTNTYVLCKKKELFKFSIFNVGHWYSKPPAIDVTIYCNFNPAFRPVRMLYGSVLSNVDETVKRGKQGLKYFKGVRIKLTYGEHPEEIHVLAKTPRAEGTYKIRISAFSINGASFLKDFIIVCQKREH